MLDNDPVMLRYDVRCSQDWNSQSASIDGWIGHRDFRLHLERGSNSDWMVNGEVVPHTSDLHDIDLGFTPATNTNAINRMDMQNRKSGASRVFWLDVSDWRMKPLAQAYVRQSPTSIAYTSPDHDYHTELTVDDFGIVRTYPGLWEAMDMLDR